MESGQTAVCPPRVNPLYVKEHPHDFDRERFSRKITIR